MYEQRVTTSNIQQTVILQHFFFFHTADYDRINLLCQYCPSQVDKIGRVLALWDMRLYSSHLFRVRTWLISFLICFLFSVKIVWSVKPYNIENDVKWKKNHVGKGKNQSSCWLIFFWWIYWLLVGPLMSAVVVILGWREEWTDAYS